MVDEILKKYYLTEETLLKMFNLSFFHVNPHSQKVLDINDENDSYIVRYEINKSWVWASEIELGEYKIELYVTVFDRPCDKFQIDMVIYHIPIDQECMSDSDQHIFKFDRFFYELEEEHFQQNLVQDVVFSYEFYKEMNTRFSTVISEYKRLTK